MKGFTLVELMVALAVFGLIAAAGVAVLGLSVDNRVAVKAFADRTAALQQSRALLKADLAQAADRPVRGADGRQGSQALVGGGDGGALLALTRRGWSNPTGAPRASMQRVEYRLNGDRLERRVRPMLDGAEAGPPQVLQDGVEVATVVFIARGQESPVWVARPDGPLPEAVRLELTLRDYGEVSQLFLVGAGTR